MLVKNILPMLNFPGEPKTWFELLHEIKKGIPDFETTKTIKQVYIEFASNRAFSYDRDFVLARCYEELSIHPFTDSELRRMINYLDCSVVSKEAVAPLQEKLFALLKLMHT